MKVIKAERDQNLRNIILEKLSKADKFIAISFDKAGNTPHPWFYVNNEEAIFEMEALKYKIMWETFHA